MKKAIIIFFISTSIFSQINISRLSLDFAYVRNYQSVDDYLYSFAPEIKVGGKFYTEVLEWEVHTSYWDDGINEELNGIMDHTTFSYSNFVVGGKIYFIPSKLRFHLLLNGGFSYRYITQEYIGGSLSGIPYDDKSYDILSMDLGAGFRYNINSNLRVRTELNLYISLNGDVGNYNRFNNGAVKLGFDYFIN